jgi:hypothetical protein
MATAVRANEAEPGWPFAWVRDLIRAVGRSETVEIADGVDGASFVICRYRSPDDAREAAAQLRALHGMWAHDQGA